MSSKMALFAITRRLVHCSKMLTRLVWASCRRRNSRRSSPSSEISKQLARVKQRKMKTMPATLLKTAETTRLTLRNPQKKRRKRFRTMLVVTRRIKLTRLGASPSPQWSGLNLAVRIQKKMKIWIRFCGRRRRLGNNYEARFQRWDPRLPREQAA